MLKESTTKHVLYKACRPNPGPQPHFILFYFKIISNQHYCSKLLLCRYIVLSVVIERVLTTNHYIHEHSGLYHDRLDHGLKLWLKSMPVC